MKENKSNAILTSIKEVTPVDTSLIENQDKSQIDIYRWFEPSSLDTTIDFNENYQIVLKPADSIFFDEYFLSNFLIDSLTDPYDNWHLKAIAIENFLLPKNIGLMKRDSSGLYVKLKSGIWKLLTVDPMTEETDHSFEHFFNEYGFYSIRVQWYEGNAYKLINSENGDVIDMIGRPYFSPDGQYVVSINADIETGYSSNGFQVFKNSEGQLELLGWYDPCSWGAVSAKWIDNCTLVIIGETMEFVNQQPGYLRFYSKLKLNKK